MFCGVALKRFVAVYKSQRLQKARVFAAERNADNVFDLVVEVSNLYAAKSDEASKATPKGKRGRESANAGSARRANADGARSGNAGNARPPRVEISTEPTQPAHAQPPAEQPASPLRPSAMEDSQPSEPK